MTSAVTTKRDFANLSNIQAMHIIHIIIPLIHIKHWIFHDLLQGATVVKCNLFNLLTYNSISSNGPSMVHHATNCDLLHSKWIFLFTLHNVND